MNDDLASGFYFGGAFAVGLEQFDDFGASADFDEAFGLDLWGGYRLNRILGLEGQFTYLEGFDTQVLGVDVDFTIVAVTANAKLFALAGRIQPFALIGVGVGYYEANIAGGFSVDESDAIIRVGGGVDLYFLDGFAFVAGVDYVITTGDIKDADILQLKFGLQHQF